LHQGVGFSRYRYVGVVDQSGCGVDCRRGVTSLNSPDQIYACIDLLGRDTEPLCQGAPHSRCASGDAASQSTGSNRTNVAGCNGPRERLNAPLDRTTNYVSGNATNCLAYGSTKLIS
jgi:hypothetical protein